jgi:hypothetical protein
MVRFEQGIENLMIALLEMDGGCENYITKPPSLSKG